MAEAERRTIEAELPSVIERLKRCASRTGVVSQRAFALEADRLGLTTVEQQRRLRNGLAIVGIHVRPSRRRQANHHSAPVSDFETRAVVPSVKATAPIAPPAVAPESRLVATEAARRLAQARRMLARYADADGAVSKLAHDGVVRLHGLSPAEARELTAGFPITRPRPPGMSVRAVTGGQAGSTAPVSVAAPSAARPKVPIGEKSARPAVSVMDERPADAVRAARAVLEEDRWRRGTAKILLKAEEEVGLAVLLRGGTDRLGRSDRLGRDVPAEEIAALPRDSERWRAYECLVLHNQRLVWKIALGYQGRGLDVDDLVQHGTIGLMRAIRRFDATKGYKLSTYATWWIKQAITRAVADEGTLIRLPAYVHEKVSKVAVAERKLLSEGRARTVDNVAYVSGLTFAEVEEVRRISRPTDSLDRIIGDDTALGDLIIGPNRLPGPDLVLIRKELLARLRHVLEHLTERERHVVIRRTGLDGDEPDTLEDIGAVFGVTRERIRQIESKVKWKFRGQLDRHGLMPPPP
ncbi:RNA polymerase sigma factor RpoD/SigA [Streptomyces sp. ISL-100]|uniref:sigma-70 family RNA polymerase sigma factor n=1 Tax=Streptomyces sp. ISL-100 TaxID=2819173 RepID=UPI001BE84665|nr:sigma-70 family RNA polymerase sigma factor [Streptomyces sp. ISL-100]MBT2398316.1 sigma-70 family RNA polymerase sigma factor [Streptomyces sp. ISL-100]